MIFLVMNVHVVAIRHSNVGSQNIKTKCNNLWSYHLVYIGFKNANQFYKRQESGYSTPFMQFCLFHPLI